MKKDLLKTLYPKKADLPYTILTKLESGVITKPTIQTVAKIAKGLDVSIDDLIN